MERNKIIIIGLIIVIIALVGIALYMFNGQQQQSTQIKVLGNKTIEEDGALNVKLTLLNGTGIKNKKINITVVDKKNKKVLKKTVKTNSKGKASIDLENISKGTYVVNITFAGDENYSANTTSQKIKIIEKKVVETEPKTTSEVTQTEEEPTEQNERNIDDMDGDGNLDIFYSESYNDDTGLVQYYTTRGGEELIVYEDNSYEYFDSQGNVEVGYF